MVQGQKSVNPKLYENIQRKWGLPKLSTLRQAIFKQDNATPKEMWPWIRPLTFRLSDSLFEFYHGRFLKEVLTRTRPAASRGIILRADSIFLYEI